MPQHRLTFAVYKIRDEDPEIQMLHMEATDDAAGDAQTVLSFMAGFPPRNALRTLNAACTLGHINTMLFANIEHVDVYSWVVGADTVLSTPLGSYEYGDSLPRFLAAFYANN